MDTKVTKINKYFVSMIMAGLLVSSTACTAAMTEDGISKPASAAIETTAKGSSASDQTNPNAPETSMVPVTQVAKSIGITDENYPAIDGSTSTLPIVQLIYRSMFGESATTSDKYPEAASKTVPSYERLIKGEVDMILVPYASEAVLQTAEAAGVELEWEKIAAEALIFITAKDNPINSITLDQVREIYLQNSIRNWSAIGGPDRQLVPICRNSDSGSQSQMDNLILHNEPMHPEIINNHIVLNMEDMLYQVAYYHTGGLSAPPSNSFALGYTLYTYLQSVDNMTGICDELKILDIDGLTASRETIADGYYPLTDGYYAVLRKDLPQDHPARRIVQWLGSEGAKQGIEDRGFIHVAE